MRWEARKGGWDTRGPKMGGRPKNSGRPGGSGSLQKNWTSGGVGVPRRVNGRGNREKAGWSGLEEDQKTKKKWEEDRGVLQEGSKRHLFPTAPCAAARNICHPR